MIALRKAHEWSLDSIQQFHSEQFLLFRHDRVVRFNQSINAQREEYTFFRRVSKEFRRRDKVLFSGNACSPRCWPYVTRICRRLGIMWSVTIRKSGWGLLKSNTAMPTPTPARRVPLPPRIRTAAVRRGLAAPKRASSRGRADRTDRIRPRSRIGHRPAAVPEAIIPLTSPTLPVVYLAAPLTAISPIASKIPTERGHRIVSFHRF